jgi:hypothetical protein
MGWGVEGRHVRKEKYPGDRVDNQQRNSMAIIDRTPDQSLVSDACVYFTCIFHDTCIPSGRAHYFIGSV